MGKKKTKKKTSISRSGRSVLLPADVILELLSRLPVKSLCRFKCVSKEWPALISSSDLGSVRDLHEKRKKNSLPLMWTWVKKNHKGEDGGNYFSSSLVAVDMAAEKLENQLKLDVGIYDNTNFNFRYITCCHGLMCFSPSSYPLPNGDNILIWNPCTRELLKLPVSPNSTGHHGDYIIGFGYISLPTNQYKIVSWSTEVIGHDDSGGKVSLMTCHVYTLRDMGDIDNDHISRGGGGSVKSGIGGWRAALGTNHYYGHCLGLDKRNVCVEGVIYWLDWYDHHHLRILAFDLRKEESEIISIPKDGKTANLMELKGSLCFAQITKRGEVITWTLLTSGKDDHGKQWVPGFTIRHHSLSCSSSFRLLLYVQKGGGEYLAFQSCSTIFYYDINAGTIRRSFTNTRVFNNIKGNQTFEMETKLLRIYPCAAYVESLFRLLGN